ncbi:interleukin-34 isoform X3 [Equus asinus]|uniref:Interleukin-34 n=1 Tax=Equus asinus TaxID=9793 RepID=A0A9L0JEZ4_EQUAS|nr:interleukin-34 isoform X2 [Equus caballus]XP_005608475.1 interleukin-34 isoform X2 [Equus caballus]XP_014593948.1 interleukin-34 isoform X2 [Equus caballus]XP_014684634.1 interleukin-34 isoform X2 [Equus asinus]XP_014684635.1 interleukin-34 isoform X2 [Equus asinus]XP_014684636.1 interleukin-34 isoform X2 [Equus asinus]XP_014684638.1 interleukin-34 isoform X2 [Equus asinus]XP_014684639.1 interleukin-34 isoform X2 [Equus asinus]XP_023493075.1 interleukin-34 isoform X2 [Equus caballus]
MPRGLAWLRYFGILLGMALGNKGLEVWPLTQSEECAVTGFLRDKLQYRNRLQYMKHYFPINYRVSVPYEGVLRMANVTRLQRARVSQQELRYLWVWVSLSATEWVQEVLLEDHPSWKYLEEVHTLLLDVQQSLRDVEVSPQVEAVLSLLSAPGLSLKLVRPKALLDNCFRVMELLYCPCCKHSSVLNWQDCELPSPQPHSPESSSSQCVAAQLYPWPQQPPTSLPRSPGSEAGVPPQ